MSGTNDINTNFFKLLYGSNYTKLRNDDDFKEASEDFDFTSIYDDLASESDDGTVRKSDLIDALKDEIDNLGLRTQDFDRTDKSRYNTDEDKNIEELIDIFSDFDDDRNFSSEDLEYLENMDVNYSGDKITLKDEDGDEIQTIKLKRNSKETITGVEKEDNRTSSSNDASENILKLIYGKNYSKVKNKPEIKDFDINKIYRDLKEETGSSRIDEYDLVDAIINSLYDHDDIDEDFNTEEVVAFLSSLDNRDGFSRSDLSKLKNMTVSSTGKSVSLDGEKYTIERDYDGNIEDIYERESSSSSSSSTSPIGPGYIYPDSSGTVNNGVQYPISNTPSNINIDLSEYTSDKINNDKNEVIQNKGAFDEAIRLINMSNENQSSTNKVSKTSMYGKIVAYTVEVSNGKYVHVALDENGKLKDANYYSNTNPQIARATFDSNTQLLQNILLDKVDAQGKKGVNSFAETTAVFDSNGNLTSINYDKNESGICEVSAVFDNNNLSQLSVNKNDSGINPSYDTYKFENGSFTLSASAQNNNTPAQAYTAKDGTNYYFITQNGITKYYKDIATGRQEITKEEFDKNRT